MASTNPPPSYILYTYTPGNLTICRCSGGKETYTTIPAATAKSALDKAHAHYRAHENYCAKHRLPLTPMRFGEGLSQRVRVEKGFMRHAQVRSF